MEEQGAGQKALAMPSSAPLSNEHRAFSIKGRSNRTTKANLNLFPTYTYILFHTKHANSHTHSMSSQPIPVSVIGYGSSARTFHLPFVASLPERFILHSIQQRPGSKSGPPASDAFPDVKIIPSFEEVISGPSALPKPGLLVITTANTTHYTFAKQALEAGYHVIVEKPITWNVAEAEDLVAISASRGLVCASFNNRRWDADFLTVKSLLAPPASSPGEPSALGTPTYYESRFDRYRPLSKGGWREESGFDQGGGLLLDLGSHLADQREYTEVESLTSSTW